MRRLLAGLAGGFGLAALVRALRRRRAAQPAPADDPAAELRARLEEARGAADDRDEFDAAEGVALDEAVGPSLEERRRAVHDRGRQALGQMHADEDD